MEKSVESIYAKDVFISYRRKDGATAARLLCDALEHRGISVFFDRESIGAGNFDDAIRQHLETAPNLIVVVSEEMFSRGRTETGDYDDTKVADDWVYEELRIALEKNKTIIPVFVNGVDGFPSELPSSISEIARKDALKLNHEHFEVELSKLIGRLVTRKHELLWAYVSVCGSDQTDDENMDRGSNNVWTDLLRVCASLSSSASKEIQNNLVQTIKNLWVRKSSNNGAQKTDSEVLDVLLERESVYYVKLLCRTLGIDWRGGMSRMKENLGKFLQGDQRVIKPYDQSKDDDRLQTIVAAFSETFKSTSERQRMGEILEERLDVQFYGRRSSFDIFYDTCTQIDVEDIFEALGGYFSESEVKNLSAYIFAGEGRGRKNELIQKICDFANYRDEDETQEISVTLDVM